MKKFFCFLLLLIAGGYIFFTGWIQIKVKPDTIAVVQSKIRGIINKPVISGNFTWYWDFLIPGNAKLNVFDLKPYNTEKTITGAISEGNAFTSGDLLSYSFTYSITISYTPDSIVKLLKDNHISNNEDLEQYLNNATASICQAATSYYLTKNKNDSSFMPEFVKREDLIKAINSYKDFPYLDVVIISLTDYKLPNKILYEKLMNENFNKTENN